MAGDDATSTAFATAYDAGAREAVAALADLTHAFIGAGRLLATTGANHEARSPRRAASSPRLLRRRPPRGGVRPGAARSATTEPRRSGALAQRRRRLDPRPGRGLRLARRRRRSAARRGDRVAAGSGLDGRAGRPRRRRDHAGRRRSTPPRSRSRSTRWATSRPSSVTPPGSCPAGRRVRGVRRRGRGDPRTHPRAAVRGRADDRGGRGDLGHRHRSDRRSAVGRRRSPRQPPGAVAGAAFLRAPHGPARRRRRHRRAPRAGARRPRRRAGEGREVHARAGAGRGGSGATGCVVPPRKRGWLSQHEVPARPHDRPRTSGKTVDELRQRLKQQPGIKPASSFDSRRGCRTADFRRCSTGETSVIETWMQELRAAVSS